MSKSWSGRSLSPARVLVTAVVGCVALAAGCGSDSETSSAGAAEEPAAAASASEKVTIGFVESFTSIPFYQVAGRGAEAAGRRDGNATVKVVGPPKATGTAEATIAQNLVQSDQPDGVAANPCVLPAWTRTLASLVRDVPDGNVVAWNCSPVGTSSQTSPVKTYVGASFVDTGYQSASIAVKAGGLSPSTTGTALVANCSKGVPVLDYAQIGTVRALKELLPKAKVVEFASNLEQGRNTAAWTSELGRQSNVVFAVGMCDQDAMSLALLKKRRADAKFVAGVNSANSLEIFRLIESGVLAGGVSVAPWVEANVTVRMLIDGARGKKPPVGWVDAGLYPVTKENAADWVKGSSSPEAEEAFFTPYADRVMKELSARTRPLADVVSPDPGSS